ncbi:hypothetical protein RZS28_06770 [Methylocapsa polymorpha]|uniref:Uncharacterized protein n=1 Tax=Methylocapsa polymorpha TaxID=3080828 RepID=A0ABZ0HUM6_9HYPH|nr:hypothetical protein RZS28_06770 [Methylocapsa sp. RX1]
MVKIKFTSMKMKAKEDVMSYDPQFDFFAAAIVSLLSVLLGAWLGSLVVFKVPPKRFEPEVWGSAYGSISATAFALSAWFFLSA